jgi:hypothetical protein
VVHWSAGLHEEEDEHHPQPGERTAHEHMSSAKLQCAAVDTLSRAPTGPSAAQTSTARSIFLIEDSVAVMY